MLEILKNDENKDLQNLCTEKNKLQKVSCKQCGKTLMFFKPTGEKRFDCVTVEIKCRNRECRAINEIKLCHIICE